MMVKQFVPILSFLFIIIFATVFGPLPSADAQKVHALLIILGNDRDIRASVEKNESSIQTLLRQVSENCEVRMTIMKSTDETTGIVNEKTLTNGNVTAQSSPQQLGIIKANQVVQWIRDLSANGEDTILIYYSGHGSMDAVGTHILNFDPEVTNDFVARDGLRKQLKQKSVRLKILITDTCSTRVQTPPPIARVYAKVQSRERRYTKNLFLAHRGFLDITAASKGQYAWGNDEIGGYFTVSLIGSFTAEADADEDRFLSWEEVSDVTRSKTQKLFSETIFLPHNQRKLDEVGQTTQTPVYYELPRKLTQYTPIDIDRRRDTTTENRRTAPRIPQTIIGQDGAEMVLIPAGEFQMGNKDSKADPDEQPVHTVYVDEFYIDKYEVTNAQYKKFIDENPLWQKERISQTHSFIWYLDHWDGNNYPVGKDNHPVINVSWYAAMAYTRWAGKRLPTEAEWEKAARGGLANSKYPWGNSIDSSKANYAKKYAPDYPKLPTSAVGYYPPNGYGLHDMAGNVWEWCLDVYDSDSYTSFSGGDSISQDIAKNVILNFMKVDSRVPRVLRGGSWVSRSEHLRVADRYRSKPQYGNRNIGFRCAKSVTP